MYLDDYKKKIEDVFSDTSKFSKLDSDPLENNLTKCRIAVKSLKNTRITKRMQNYYKLKPKKIMRKTKTA